MSTIGTPLLGTTRPSNARDALRRRVELCRDRDALAEQIRKFNQMIDAIDDVVAAEMKRRGVWSLYFCGPGPGMNYFTAELDKHGELAVTPALAAHDLRLPEPQFDDLTDEEYESLTEELRDEFRRHPHALAMRPKPKAVDCPAGDLTDDDPVLAARRNVIEDMTLSILQIELDAS